MGQRSTISGDPDDPRHGTTNGYTNLGCRCTRCARANAEGVQTVRQARRAAGLPPDDPRHGKDSTYQNWGCRCRRCTSAHAANRQAYRDRKASRTEVGP